VPHRPNHVCELVEKLAASVSRLHFCYEAGPCGYGLYGQLFGMGYNCIVVAPSLTPVKAGDWVKTDRRDSMMLTKLHRARELTAVWVAQPKQRTPHPERAETVGDFILWDEVFPALNLRNRFGRESWIVQTRIRGSSVRGSLGVVSKLTRSAARQAAAALIAALAEERAAATCPETTLGSFLVRWLTDCAGQWKPATCGAHTSGALTHILPQLGARPVAALTAREVADWYAVLPGSPGSKTRHLAVLSGMMRHAELIGLRAPGRACRRSTERPAPNSSVR
jgi:hypothetical protein